MKTLLIYVILVFNFHTGFCQVNLQTLDDLASRLASTGQINIYGQIYATYNTSIAAIGCQRNNCSIYVNPNAMNSKSLNTWAFIIGHEIGHYYLGHTGCGAGGKQDEMDADIIGARLAKNAGYNIQNYIIDLQRQPNTCSRSHGCWSERINNLKREFGYQENNSHRCKNWISILPFPWL